MDENKNVPQEAAAPRPDVPAPSSAGHGGTPPPRYTFPMEKPELVFGALLLCFSLLLCNSLFYFGFNLGYALGAGGTVVCTLLYLLRKGHRLDGYTAALLGLSLAILAAMPRSDDGGLKFLASCALLLVPGLAFCLMSGQNRRSPQGISSLLDGFRAFFVLGIGRWAESGRGIREACASTGAIGRRGSSVALGLVIAAPLLAVLLPLLMFADAAFEGLLDLLPELRWSEIFGTVFFGTVLGYVLYTRAVAMQYLPKKAQPAKPCRGLNSITVNTVLGCVALVYLVYLVSQLAYFVGGFSGILPQNYTLAQYARRGFFEMAWLCAINLGLMGLAIGLVSTKEKPRLSTRLLCLFLGLVTLFLASTASAKMFLYIGSYGLTRLRVLTQCFIFWLGLSTVFVCIWLFRPGFGYMKPALLAALALCAVLLWADVDTVVARYNVRAYQAGSLETVDVSHLDQLNLAAVPYLAELTRASDPEIAQMAQDVLERRARYGLSSREGLRGWNYAAAQAKDILRDYAEPVAEASEIQGL